jgi:uncharacterized Ntn-hydrolase superfamily protein
MNSILAALLVAVLTAAPAVADESPRTSGIRPVATYSIVARDPDTGHLGVAVQSHWFSVGALVPWARAGVGAVATQSMVDPSYGPKGLDLMAGGQSAAVALETLLMADANADIRQVGMVDAFGGVATHTGNRCIAEAGHELGQGFAVQANLMGPATVPQAMAKAFTSARGPLAERLLAALAAAEHEGGDIRGRQSVAILVVKAEASGEPWNDTLVDLRIEDHPDPITEMTRLLNLHRGYELMNAGDLAVEKGDLEGAGRAYGQAEAILGDNLEARFWHAVALVNAGQIEQALPLFAGVFDRGPNWRELTPRLVAPGFLDADPETLKKILGARPRTSASELEW